MKSPTPGLIAQMAGFITKKRYQGATIFVDQATGLGYVHVQRLSAQKKLWKPSRLSRDTAQLTE
jgi:hypothetical protein